jgi:Protein of unknown function (DUF3168)
MTGAGGALQTAAVARLETLEALNGAYPGPPLQAAVPYATVETGGEADWGHKSGGGREVRLAVGLRDEGERPDRIRTLIDCVEAALGAAPEVPGWQLVSLQFLRSRLAREGRGRESAWTALIEYRARLLALPPPSEP